MKILIDADGCPVVDITIRLSQKYNIECIIICDTSHYYEKEGAKTITVSTGADSVDFALVNMILKGDIVITQDYGLAAMCLAKNAIPISQNGMIYCDDNILELLTSRARNKKTRMSTSRPKGYKPRTYEQNIEFSKTLKKILNTQNK